jgi:ribosomal protein L40E
VIIIGLLTATAPLFGFILFCQLMNFLWHGSRLFRAMRRELKQHPACVKCGAAPSRPGAQFCGKCGGVMLRAA